MNDKMMDYVLKIKVRKSILLRTFIGSCNHYYVVLICIWYTESFKEYLC